jgi:hypothetical protein
MYEILAALGYSNLIGSKGSYQIKVSPGRIVAGITRALIIGTVVGLTKI